MTLVWCHDCGASYEGVPLGLCDRCDEPRTKVYEPGLTPPWVGARALDGCILDLDALRFYQEQQRLVVATRAATAPRQQPPEEVAATPCRTHQRFFDELVDVLQLDRRQGPTFDTVLARVREILEEW